MDINIIISEDSLVLDVLSASEFVNVAVDPAININDTPTIIETVSVSFGLEISVETTLTIVEFTKVELNSLINVGDDLPVLEDLGYLVQDTLSITESVSLSVSAANINVDENISLIEDVAFVFFWVLSVEDTLSITESVSTVLNTAIDINDTFAIVESVSLAISDENIDLNDTISLLDGPNQTAMGDLEIGIPAVPFGDLVIHVADAAPILDVIPFFEDTIYMWESVYMEIVPSQFGDDISLSEDVSVLSVLDINVNDQVTIVDVVTIPPIIIDLSIFDIDTITESVSVEVIFLISVFDVITITDVITNIFSIRYSPSPDNPFGDDGGLI